MSDIKSLHKTARTLILNLRDGLEQLERSENVSDLVTYSAQTGLLASKAATVMHNRLCTEQAPHYGVATGLSRQLQQKLFDLQKISSQMESIWRMQVVKESTAKRDIWKR